MATRVHRGNTIPQGGATAPQVAGVAGGGMLLPDTIQVQEMADIFFENSEQNYLGLNTETLIPGRTTQFRLQNVGLGEGLELFISGSFNVRNNHATLARTVNIAPEFPYNIISSLQMMFNGKVALISASGYDLLRMMLKRNFQNQGVLDTFSAGTATPVGSYMRLDKRIANIRVSAGTLVAGDTLVGFSGLTIPAATTVRVDFEMYLDISFVMRKDLPFGLVPMQHNAIYANLSIVTNSLLSTTFETPLQMSGAEAVDVAIVTPDAVITCEPTYNFWGLPQNPDLYSFFVNNSYVITSYPRNPISSLGARALAFNFPLNYWLISSLFTVRHAADARLAHVRSLIDNPHLVYNGTIVVDRSTMRTRIAREVLHTGRQYPYGSLMFDGAQTNNLDGNSANMSRWLNMYQANNPIYYADVLAGLTLPGSFDVLLEQLIPNYVTVI